MSKNKKKLREQAAAVIESTAKKVQEAEQKQTAATDVLVDNEATVAENIRLSKKRYNDLHTTVRVKKQHKTKAEEVVPIVAQGKTFSNTSRITEALIDWFSEEAKSLNTNPIAEYYRLQGETRDLKENLVHVQTKMANKFTEASILQGQLVADRTRRQILESKAAGLQKAVQVADQALEELQKKAGFFRELIQLIKKYW